MPSLPTSLFDESTEIPLIGRPDKSIPILSHGMGVESSTILTRWMLEPESRNFDLDDLTVITAQTGNEFPDTRLVNQTYLLPQMANLGIRWVQLARGGPKTSDGIVIMSDSRQTEICHTEGVYKLSDELLAAGTVPEFAHGRRKCSIKAKGDVLDYWIERAVGPHSFRHFIGFNADELKRVERDKSYSSAERQTEYPLVQWGWGRQKCEDYLREIYGVDWPKSCCSYCPFAGAKESNLSRYRMFPELAAFTMMMEYMSTALNPRVTLYSGSSVIKAIAADNNVKAFEAFDAQCLRETWAIYRVRRIYFSAQAWRKTEILATGTRTEIEAEVEARSYVEGRPLSNVTSHRRFYRIEKNKDEANPLEEFLVAAPKLAIEKARSSFDTRWDEVVNAGRQVQLL